VPGALVAELRAWVAAGLCQWDLGQVRIERPALDRLRGGFKPRVAEAHGSVPGVVDPELRQLLTWVQLAGRHATADLLARVADRSRWQLDLELAELARAGAVRVDQTGEVVAILDQDLAATWPDPQRRDAHRVLALALPVGAEGRLFHVLAAGMREILADEAIATAHQQRATGRVGEAEATLRESARALRRAGVADGEARLLGPLVRTAVAANTVRAVERARYEVERALQPAPALLALCDAAIAARQGKPDEALEICDLLGPLPDFEAELARHHTRMLAAQSRLDQAEGVIADLRALAAESADPELQGLVPGWEGLLRFKQGRYLEAAQLHEQSATLRAGELGRISARVNAGLAWLEACELDRAERVGRQVVAEALQARAPSYEAYGEWILRSVHARRRDGSAPDLELVEAVGALGSAAMVWRVATTEALLAWHAGQPAVCARLSRRCLEALRIEPHAEHQVVVEAMLAMADPAAEVDVEGLVAHAGMSAIPAVGLQVLGMLAGSGRLRGDHRALAEDLYSRLPALYRDYAGGMLAPIEALERIRSAALGGG